jgi:hypothetical protein
MGYRYADGNDFGALSAVATPVQRVVAVRRSLPAGSIVPTLLARRPSREIGLRTSEATTIQTARRNMIRRLRGISRMSPVALAPVSRTIKSFGGLAGFGSGSGSDDDLGVPDYASSLADAMEEIDSLDMRATDIQRLGNVLTAQRAGEIGAALGLDVTWRDLVNNCGAEFARLRTDLPDVDFDNILSTVGFERISAVFRDQGQNVEGLVRLATSARGLYDNFGTDAINQVVRDATAFGEGGMRQLLEATIGDGAATWLNGENLQRLGDAATGWVAAASSGSTMGYVSAAVGTATALATIGVAIGATSVVVPVGTIIAAAGALITLILSLVLGDEETDPAPEVKPCVNPERPERWMYNPEAWTAVAMWAIAKDNRYFDSDLYGEVQDSIDRGSPRLAQQIIADDYSVTIDRYTGEVMVQEKVTGTAIGAPVRLLDYIDRDVLMPPEEPTRAIEMFSRPDMRMALGLMAHHPAAVSGANYLWCEPHPLETQTRFLGAAMYRKSTGEYTTPFRSSVTTATVPYHLAWDRWLGRERFWKGYPASLVMSVYLAGTVPYGVRGLSNGIAISTGVGGSRDRAPIDVAARYRAKPNDTTSGPMSAWQDNYTAATGMLLAKYDGRDEVEVSFADFRTLMNDAVFRKTFRIPDPSPVVQSVPADVVRPRAPTNRCSADGRICAAPPPHMQVVGLPRGSFVVRKEASVGMSTGKKLLLGAGVVTVAGGLGWALSRRGKK